MSSGKLCVLVWFCAGPGPVLLLFRCWFLWRNANLAGGFAGRLVSWFLFAFLVVDCFFVTYFIVQLEPVRFSRLVLIRFYLLIPIAGPSLRATSAKPEEKKRSAVASPARTGCVMRSHVCQCGPCVA